MGVYYEAIPDSLKAWILEQKMLCVGTAPLSPEGHINISPKGGQYFGILSPTQFWFMDLTGSGVETHAHLHEPNNGRICVMFMAFEGAPKIVRIWGTGRAIENGTAEYRSFVDREGIKEIPGMRSVVLVDVHQVGSSCGFSVPYYDFKGWRTRLNEFFDKKEKAYQAGKEEESIDRYWAHKSQLSVDGLPGMQRGYVYAQKHNIAPLKKFVGPYAPEKPRLARSRSEVTQMQVLLVAIMSFIIGVIAAITVASPEMVARIQNKEAALRVSGWMG